MNASRATKFSFIVFALLVLFMLLSLLNCSGGGGGGSNPVFTNFQTASVVIG